MAHQPPRSTVAAFAADPTSAAKARRFVMESLTHLGVDPPAIERAEMVATELVTNAVLHAGGAPTVTLRLEDDTIRLEVQDQSPTMPVLRNYGREAATGRGLNIVTVAADKWGVEQGPTGKTVWAEIPVRADVPTTKTAMIEGSPFPTAAPTDENGATTLFTGVPVKLYLALEQHNESVLRECELLAIQLNMDGDDRPELPTQLSDLVLRAMKYFNVQMQAFRLAVQQAEARGEKFVELKVNATPTYLAHSVDFAAVLRQADDLAEQGLLLTAPAPGPVRHLRDWFITELKSQLEGVAPRPYKLPSPD